MNLSWYTNVKACEGRPSKKFHEWPYIPVRRVKPVKWAVSLSRWRSDYCC